MALLEDVDPLASVAHDLLLEARVLGRVAPIRIRLADLELSCIAGTDDGRRVVAGNQHRGESDTTLADEIPANGLVRVQDQDRGAVQWQRQLRGLWSQPEKRDTSEASSTQLHTKAQP